jgi:CubicO group peptidase (beta-lactamase class C family)
MPIDLSAPEIRAAITLAEAQLEGEQRDRKIPGISAGIVYDQQLIWQRGYGFSDLDKKIAADERTVYRIASITKLFTSTMLMRLRDAGKLSLDDPLEKYLPQFKIKSTFMDARPPTFRMVASHAAGLPREGNHQGWRTLDMPTIDTLLAGLDGDEMRLPTMVEPKYSNLGIGIMGYTLSQIAGQPYGDYVTEHILKPLGMNNSGFARPADNHYAVGYWRDGEAFKPTGHWDEQGFRPGGGMYSTVADITRFIAMQFRDQPANGGDQVLGSSTIREMQMPVSVTQDFETGFGIGWGIRRLAGQKVIGHSGGLPGYTTNISLAPALKLAVIVFTNTNTDPVTMANKVLELLIPVFKRQQGRQEVPASAETVDSWKRYAGRYTRQGDDTNIEIIDGKLYLISPGESLDAAVRLLPHAEHQFRMAGGHSSGDTVTFDFNDAGEITGMMIGAYPMDKASD